MGSPIEATMVLADAAVADPTGKVHMLGAGWSVTSSPTAPAALAVLLKIPWDRANEQLSTVLTLVDADGHPANINGQHLGAQQTLEVGRPPGLPHGTPIDASFVITLAPMPLPPGRYQWRLQVGGDEFAVGFEVRGQARPASPSPPSPTSF